MQVFVGKSCMFCVNRLATSQSQPKSLNFDAIVMQQAWCQKLTLTRLGWEDVVCELPQKQCSLEPFRTTVLAGPIRGQPQAVLHWSCERPVAPCYIGQHSVLHCSESTEDSTVAPHENPGVELGCVATQMSVQISLPVQMIAACIVQNIHTYYECLKHLLSAE